MNREQSYGGDGEDFSNVYFFLEVTSHDISFLAGESLDFCI